MGSKVERLQLAIVELLRLAVSLLIHFFQDPAELATIVGVEVQDVPFFITVNFDLVNHGEAEQERDERVVRVEHLAFLRLLGQVPDCLLVNSERVVAAFCKLEHFLGLYFIAKDEAGFENELE